MPSVREWSIITTATGRERQVDVLVYDDVEELRREAQRWDERWVAGVPADYHSESVSTAHGFEWFETDEEGNEALSPLSAILRFSADSITPEIVSHEIAHVAMHLYALDIVQPEDSALEHIHGGNEEFGDLLGQLFVAVWTALNEPE